MTKQIITFSQKMFLLLLLPLLSALKTSSAFIPKTQTGSRKVALPSLEMVAIGKNYQPKWKKKKTLAEDAGGTLTSQDVGLTGSVPVVFKMGDESKTTMARIGQPIRDVALQADQFIKYGCGKGECGTCEALCNGKWIRPCTAVVPADHSGGDYIIQVKKVKSRKTISSGKFYSFRSILMGFYTNVIGMLGFFLTRRAAKKNYNERMEYEDMVKQKVLERKALKP